MTAMAPRLSAPILLAAAILAGCHGKQEAHVPAAVQPQFADATAPAGIRFRHFTGADGRYFMPESIGPGGAFLDYDGDGWLDVFLVNGSNWPDRPPAGNTCALYRNQHDGTFKDVTREAGLS